MAVPSMMPATAMKDATASVDNPVSPCPIEQPNAITPPVPISAAPPAERSMWLRRGVAFEMEAAGRERRDQAAGEHAADGRDAEIERQPVDSMTYCRASAIGAMKVSEVTGAGLKSSAPR